MNRFLAGVSLLLVATSCAASGPDAVRGPSRLELEPCLLPDSRDTQSIKAECGTWDVAEDRSKDGGRHIPLRVAVVPAVSRNPSPYPIMVLAGGPGQAATEIYGALESAFRELHKAHDVLLIDQRGTGASNPLRCPEVESEELLSLDDDAFIELFTACRNELPADLSQYTTEASIADFEEVREALGYPQAHLYGGSYGTRVGLAYLKRYPESVRTAVLDGVVPPSLALGSTVARDAQRALDRMLERCESEEPCSNRFPDLRQQFNALVEALRTQPVTVTLNHPRRGTPLDVEFSSEMFGLAVRLLSYSPETLALLPLLIESAANEKWEPIAAQFLLVTDSLGESIAAVMGTSIGCTEDFPFLDAREAEQLNSGTFLGSTQTRTTLRLCPDWPRGTVPDDFRDPVTADRPVLLLSGANDPVTPPSYGDEVASHLPNALHLTLPGVGHGAIGRGCVPDLVTEFIQNESLEGLDSTCIETVRAAPFFLSFAGPIPEEQAQ